MFSTTTDILVPFHDVDSMHVVWHGHYVKYLEVARCEFLEACGYSYQAMQASGYSWPIIDMRIKYIKSLQFGQRVRVQCSLREWEYRLKLDYVISDLETGERLTKAYTIQVAIDMAKNEMCFESPAILQQKLITTWGPLPG
ncbi:acyl-CoA thioesterase [Cellvibrio mixtus]|uniref:acyl-CoA thioesterase n=1 Tax=Cellvibrio mixtus TaxID=39650 RepID=UPI0005872946|nr:acyl-CoA thioesterase [Cellvibrio mixtus]